jgi:hypothetical protein
VLEVAIGGGDHPDVHAVGAVRAHALDLALLERAQLLGLERQGQLAPPGRLSPLVSRCREIKGADARSPPFLLNQLYSTLI